MQKDKKGTLSHQKIKCSFLDYAQLLMIGRSGQWTRSPSATPLQPKKIKCSFMDYLQLLMTGQAGGWTQILSATPLQPKRWNAHFWIMFNFWWSARLVNGLETPSTTPLQPKKWNAHFWTTFNFLWSARLVKGVEPCPPCLSNQKNEMLILDYVQLLMTGRAGWWTQTPSATPLQPKRWNAHFWITFNFWWSAGLVNGLEPHPAPLSSHKNEMLVFGLCSTSDDLPGWSMDSNPICHPSPAKKMKCSFLNYVQLLMIGWAIQAKNVNRNAKKWKRPPKSSKNKMFIFGLHSTSDDWPRDLSKKRQPKCKKMKKAP